MSHDPNPIGRLNRADARLKLIKAVDAVADALEILSARAYQADPADLLKLAEGFPFPNLNTSVLIDLAATARATRMWQHHLRNVTEWEKLGTRRWPERH